MKKPLNDNQSETAANTLSNFLSEHKVLSMILGNKLIKSAVKKPFATIGVAVVAGYLISYCLKKKVNNQD